MEHVVTIVSGLCERPERFRIQMAGITYPDRSYHILRNRSDIYCIEYVLEGHGDVVCGERHVHPRAGDVYILPPGVRHDYRASPTDPYKKIWMNVSGLLIDALYREYQLGESIVYPHASVLPIFEGFLDMCERAARPGGEASDAAAGSLSRRGALMIHDIFARLAEQHLDGRLLSSPDRYALTIREYLDRHVGDNIRLAVAAHDLGLSVSQLSRVFSRAYGESPYRYYLCQRAELARALLDNTGMRVGEISARLHCADAHYFSNQFKAVVGVSPRAYREQTSARR